MFWAEDGVLGPMVLTGYRVNRLCGKGGKFHLVFVQLKLQSERAESRGDACFILAIVLQASEGGIY